MIIKKESVSVDRDEILKDIKETLEKYDPEGGCITVYIHGFCGTLKFGKCTIECATYNVCQRAFGKEGEAEEQAQYM